MPTARPPAVPPARTLHDMSDGQLREELDALDTKTTKAAGTRRGTLRMEIWRRERQEATSWLDEVIAGREPG